MMSNDPDRVIEALESKCKVWKARRRVVIHCLDQGYAVNEIAARTGFSLGYIHSVQERLANSLTV